MARLELSPEQRGILDTIPYFKDMETARVVAKELKTLYDDHEKGLYITYLEADCREASDQTPEDTMLIIHFEDSSHLKNSGPEETMPWRSASGVEWRNPKDITPKDPKAIPEPIPHAVGVYRAALLSRILGVQLFMNKGGDTYVFSNDQLQYVQKTPNIY